MHSGYPPSRRRAMGNPLTSRSYRSVEALQVDGAPCSPSPSNSPRLPASTPCPPSFLRRNVPAYLPVRTRCPTSRRGFKAIMPRPRTTRLLLVRLMPHLAIPVAASCLGARSPGSPASSPLSPSSRAHLVAANARAPLPTPLGSRHFLNHSARHEDILCFGLPWHSPRQDPPTSSRGHNCYTL